MARSSECPQSSQLRLLADGLLEGDELTRLAEHLDGCSACCARLESVTDLVPGKCPGKDSEPLKRVIQQLKTKPADTRDDAAAFGTSPLELLDQTDRSGCLGIFAGYEVLALAGSGGMGIVFQARDPSLDRVVAIKLMLPQLAANRSARERFLREARSVAAVEHDHIVTIHAVGESNGVPYLVMQFVAGMSLEARLCEQGGPLEIEEMVWVSGDVAAGLAAAHEQSLVHRDIKPANILLEAGKGRALITDFGLAKAVDDIAISQAAIFAGTPQFMAPEQASLAEVDHRADLFALGSVMYMMCTGKPPFTGPSTLAVICQVCEREPTPIRQLNADVPMWLIKLIDRLMIEDPRQRCASASEVAEFLRRSGAGARADSAGRERSSRQCTVLICAAVLAGIFGAGSFTLMSNTGPDRDAPQQSVELTDPGGAVQPGFRVGDNDRVFATLAAAIAAVEKGVWQRFAGNWAITGAIKQGYQIRHSNQCWTSRTNTGLGSMASPVFQAQVPWSITIRPGGTDDEPSKSQAQRFHRTGLPQ